MAREVQREGGNQEGRFYWEVVSEETTQTKTMLGSFTASVRVLRAKVPGGWFVKLGAGTSAAAFFYPDPEHAWDGGTLP